MSTLNPVTSIQCQGGLSSTRCPATAGIPRNAKNPLIAKASAPAITAQATNAARFAEALGVWTCSV